MPSVPVIPIVPIDFDGSPYHQAADRARAARADVTTSWGSGVPGIGCSTRAAAAPAAAAAATKSWPSTWNPGTATNRVPGLHGPGVVGDAGDLDVREPGGRDRQVVAPRAPDEIGGSQSRDEVPERPRTGRLCRGDQVGDAAVRGLSAHAPLPRPTARPARAVARPAA